jgi:hypothetical protein
MVTLKQRKTGFLRLLGLILFVNFKYINIFHLNLKNKIEFNGYKAVDVKSIPARVLVINLSIFTVRLRKPGRKAFTPGPGFGILAPTGQAGSDISLTLVQWLDRPARNRAEQG